MKKIVLLAAVALSGFSACKKDYTCTCTTTSSGGLTASGNTTIKDTKRHAEKTCEDGSKSDAGGSTVCKVD